MLTKKKMELIAEKIEQQFEVVQENAINELVEDGHLHASDVDGELVNFKDMMCEYLQELMWERVQKESE